MLYNLREYHRPTDLGEALRLIGRTEVRTVPLSGGTCLVGEGASQIEAVVDLAGLGLDFIERKDSILRVGAMVRLQTLVEELRDVADGLLAKTAHRMAGLHVRNAMTIGGVLAGRDLHTPLSAALAALQARVAITGQGEEQPVWPAIPPERIEGQIITAVEIDLPQGQVGAAYEQVGRTPADHPIVCSAAIACANGGQIVARTAIGGLLSDDLVLIGDTFRGSNASFEAIEQLVNAIPEAMLLDNFLGSSAYRRGVAPVLARRALTAALDKVRAQEEA